MVCTPVSVEGRRQRRKEGMFGRAGGVGGARRDGGMQWLWEAVVQRQAVPCVWRSWEAEEEQGGTSPVTLRLWMPVLEQTLGKERPYSGSFRES